MQNKVNHSLTYWAILLLMIWYPIYIFVQNFNINLLLNFWGSIIEYRYRILWVIFINLLIILRKTLNYKKTKATKLFLHWWSTIVIIFTFIYPLLPDFKQRFGMIFVENVTDFYAIVLPIFIMIFLSNIRKVWDYDAINEIKDIMWINRKTSYKVNLSIKKSYTFLILSGYCLLFTILTWWMTIINKVNHWFRENFSKYPFLFFIFTLGIVILFFTILNNTCEKSEEKHDNSTSQKLNNKKKCNYQNIKVKFK